MSDDQNEAGPVGGPDDALMAALMSSAPRSAVTADAVSLIALAKAMFVSEEYELLNGDVVVFVSDGNGGLRREVLPALNPTLPDFISATELFYEPDSLIEYLSKYATASALALADLTNKRFAVRIDYHDLSGPGVNKHHAGLITPYDEDYAAWKKVLGVEVAQAEFGVWLEDMLHTVCTPDEDIPSGRGLIDPADLLDMLNTISIQRNIEVKSVVNSRDGTIKLRYEEDDASDVELPREVLLKMPIFAGTAPILLLAKLRFNVKPGGAVVFKWAIPGLPNIERAEFRKIGDNIRDRAGVPVLYGQTGS